MPGWARGADILTVLLALAVLRVVVLGGVRIGTVFSMSTPWRALFALLVICGVRHYLVRSRPLHERVWTWLRERAWPAYVRITGMTAAGTLRIFSLAALAVAQPLFDLLAREPAFFVARNTTTGQLATFVAGVSLALPLGLIGMEALVRRIRASAGDAAHWLLLTMLAGLLVLPLLKRWEALGTGPLLAAAVFLAGLIVLGAQRTRVVGLFLTALSPSAVIVPVVFLAHPDVRSAVLRTEDAPVASRVEHAPPIVFVVFDEFPTSSLLDRDRRIDRARFPHLARLADDATWYRNASTVSSQTVWAVPALVTGRYPVQPNAVPTRRYYPDNLFTILSESYRMTVFGRFLQLCPADVCAYDLDVHDSLGDLTADLGIAYLHIVAPPAVESLLPPIVGDWRDFAGARRFRSGDGAQRQTNERLSELDRFLETITPERAGRLYFLHTLLPHMPYQYVPSGRRYRARDYQRWREGGELLFLKSDPWLPVALQQRHLLQVEVADRFIGHLVDRLREQGVYDESLIVVTADHGASFLHGSRRREISGDGENAADIILVPLIVKLPHQAAGAISDRNVETVDVVSTIADALSAELPYAVDGRSLLDASEPDRSRKTFVQRGRRSVGVVKYPARPNDRGWEQKLRRFEGDLYGLGPHGSLVGRVLSTLDVRPGAKTGVRLARRAGFRDVDLESATLPLHVRGRLTGEPEDPVSLAVSVNGVIAATTLSYREEGRWVFATMIPEDSLIAGANEVEIFLVDGPRDEPVLRSADGGRRGVPARPRTR
ncbi:MAG: sulfatase-like hydrolase/transferase [Acidobacteria bacterium]|nr:sulfatase-like hydrolase/transferase [Acidobacteriota bacterium]